MEGDTNSKIITFEDLKEHVIEPEDRIYVVDVREYREIVETGMIPTAFNIPLVNLIAELTLAESVFKKKYNREKPRKDDLIILYSYKGRRAERGLDSLKLNEFSNYKSYSGSWAEWTEKKELGLAT